LKLLAKKLAWDRWEAERGLARWVGIGAGVEAAVEK
jgi:hypothetical protein